MTEKEFERERRLFALAVHENHVTQLLCAELLKREAKKYDEWLVESGNRKSRRSIHHNE